MKCFPRFTSRQTSKCALTGLPHCSFEALIADVRTVEFKPVRILTDKHTFDFQLGKMFARFHLERGRLLWERLRFIWKISRKPVENSSVTDRR